MRRDRVGQSTTEKEAIGVRDDASRGLWKEAAGLLGVLGMEWEEEHEYG